MARPLLSSPAVSQLTGVATQMIPYLIKACVITFLLLVSQASVAVAGSADLPFIQPLNAILSQLSDAELATVGGKAYFGLLLSDRQLRLFSGTGGYQELLFPPVTAASGSGKPSFQALGAVLVRTSRD